ncbi:band 4.1-like protein 3b isoform X17 [Girardinichthys multiradiatus]|uniref:band 4.1-like protein 3b isoform X17 n=1 Tax=Girardinichthys multiradiatus TaxID=208333 RepID=UPI001FABCE24|nr:band 4.1-like protein 3b isoform X17 [Girardinichthys multiradiatus]
MTTESGADSEAKQPQANKEAEKGKTKAAADPASPQKQPEQLPAAVGHSTPARKEQEQQEEDQESHRSSTSRLSRSPLRGVKKVKMMQCKIALLDGSDYTVNVEKRGKGHVLFDKVCEHLNLLEKDYFGITYRDVENQKNWLDPSKELKKQIRTGPWNFAFNVKFYPPDPSQLSEDITRYYLCLQLRDDVVSGRLPCSFATHTLLGSYTVQSELGDYDPEELGSDYISEIRFAPNQTKELEEKVMELHKTYKGMTPAEAEIHFLENAKKLSMYGVDLHHAKLVGNLYESLAPAEGEDSEGVEIMLGVCASGLLIYRDRLRINRFAWPKILKISYKRNNFYIKIRPGEFEQFESTIGFKLPNHRAAKRLWKVCVEHHTFFRLVSPEAPPKKFLSLGSKFRYSGRTQAQTRRASSQIARPAPLFERSSSKRYNMSRSLDGAPITENHETPVKDGPGDGAPKVIAKEDIITTVTTEREAEEEKAEREDVQKGAAETPEPAVTTTLRHDTKTDSERTDFACDGEMTATEAKDEQLAGEEIKPEVGPKGTMAAGYLVKYVADSIITDGATSSGPHGISLPTTIDDDVFLDGTLREEAEDKTLDSQEEEVSARSVVKVSPGAVRQEVSQAISDKKGTLIIFKQAENKEDTEDEGTSKKEGFAVPVESETVNEKETEASAVVKGQTSVVKMLSPKVEIKTGDSTQIKGIDSPKKAMASWISEEKVEISEVTSLFTKEVEVLKTLDELQQKAEEIQSNHLKLSLTHITVSESSAASLAVSTLGWVSSSQKASADQDEKAAVITENGAEPAKPKAPDGVEVAAKDVPVVHTETKTITYESAEVDTNGDVDPGVLLSAQTITSETTSTTMTTHITKTVKGGISETRIEKRIVITGDADIDHDEALAQAIKEAKEQHPDMSVTKVVVHKETEITPEEGED